MHALDRYPPSADEAILRSFRWKAKDFVEIQIHNILIHHSNKIINVAF